MKKLIIIVLSLCFICSTGVTTALAADNSAQVMSAEGFQQALDNPAITGIFLLGSFSIDRALILPSNRKIIISSVTDGLVTIYQTSPNTRHIILNNSDGKSFDVTFTDIVFDGKDIGGGVSVGCDSSVTFNHCKFTNNKSSGFGGGLYIAGYGSTTLSNCEISNNIASSGGGIAVGNKCELNMVGTTIKSNTATVQGGGMVVLCGPEVNASGCAITGNAAGFGGGVSLACTVSHGTSFNGGSISGNRLVPFVRPYKICGADVISFDDAYADIFDYQAYAQNN